MIRIITDTAADITLTQARAMEIEIVPMGVFFGDTPYYQLEDESFELFYQMLEQNTQLPVTSQPTPELFLSEFMKAKENGDEVLVITISSELSGTIQSAVIAKELSEYGEIHIVDSKLAAIGQRLLVELAIKLRDDGVKAGEIAQIIREAADRVVLFAALDTLKYLRKGGRIAKSAELIGTAIGIKPLITLKNGVIVQAGKARGRAGAVSGMMNLVRESGEIDPEYPVVFGYTGDAENCIYFREQAIGELKLEKIETCPVGGTVGTHVGPGVFALAYLKKE